MKPSGEDKSSTRHLSVTRLSALFRPIALTVLMLCLATAPPTFAFLGKKPEQEANAQKADSKSQNKPKPKEAEARKHSETNELEAKKDEGGIKSKKAAKKADGDGTTSVPKPRGKGPNDPVARAQAALEREDYSEGAKLYADLAKQSEQAKNWYAAATYLLRETTCLVELAEFKSGEDCIRRSLVFLENARCTDPAIRGKHLGVLATCLRRENKHEEADAVYKQALSQLSQGTELSTYYLAEYAHESGLCLAQEGKTEESEKEYRKSIDYFKRLSISQRKRIANPILSLTISLNDQGRYLEAEQSCIEGLKIGNEWGFEKPEHLAQFKCQLAIALSDRDDKKDAMISNIEEAAAIGARAEGNIDWVFGMYHSWADALIGVKKFELARDWLDKGIDLAKRRDAIDSAEVATLLRDKARCEVGLGNLDEAIACINEASKRCAGEKDSSNCAMQNASVLATIYHKQKKWDSELITLNRLNDMQMQKYADSEHPAIVATMRRLGNVLFQSGKYEAADRYFKKALAIDEKRKGKTDLALATYIQEIGTTYCVTGRYTEAVPYLLRAIAIHDKNGDFSTGQYGLYGCLDELAYCYIAMNQPEKAAPVIERLFSLQDRGDGPANGIDAVATLQSLAGVHIKHGHAEEGKKLLSRVAELRKTEKWKQGRDKDSDDTNKDKDAGQASDTIPLYTIE